jgi:thiamine-phosphate pyrophosphorylase
MRGLYAIVDTRALRARGLHPIAFATAVLVARPAALQLRAKDSSPREFLALLRAISPLCREAGVPFVANDRVDLAALAACNIVHVGQDDLAIERVRGIAPGMRVGLSTHTPEQLARALDAAPAYVAYGPVFPTASKENPDPVVGLAGLREAAIAAERAHVPLVAIGGITLERAPEVAQIADAAAVIADLLPAREGDASIESILEGVSIRARELHAALSSVRAEAEWMAARALA